MALKKFSSGKAGWPIRAKTKTWSEKDGLNGWNEK